MKKLVLLCIGILLVSCQDAKTKDERMEWVPDHDKNPVLSTAETIAYKNGLAEWEDVSEIHFTFNVDRGGNHYQRSWKWNIKTDAVVMISEKDTISYNRNMMDSIAQKTDAGFINDSYWLLAPYKLVWDEGAEISETKKKIAPISKDSLHKITITYGSEGGYTPGDAYDFFYDDTFMIQEWIFRKGNDSVPSMITTWEEYRNYNGLELATVHKDSTGGFKLYFTNIEVKK